MAVIELPALEGEASFLCEVFDTHGSLIQKARLVRWDQLLHGMIILDQAAPGVYWIRVLGPKQTWVSRLVKH